MSKFLYVFLMISALGFAQTEETSAKKEKKGGVFKDAGDAAKMVLAKQKMYAQDYVGAMNIYREVEKNEPDNASVLYYIGYCYFNLGNIEKSKEYLLKAVATNKDVKPETHLTLGKIYQLEGDFDKAIAELEQFKAAPNKDAENKDDADLFLSQCQNAKKLMAQPLDIAMINLGDNVNSKFDDKNPCISADGSKLVISSRRPKTTDAKVDAEGDGKYFEDVYMTSLDSVTRQFAAVVEMPGVNTKGHDGCTSISPDGKQIFIYRNDANDKLSRGGEVFVSRFMNGKWKTPEPLGKPISSEFWEGGACISPDGKRYFFTSERKDGFGHSDIYMVERKNKKEWGKPENLGPVVNTPYDEAGIFLAPDGKTLFFCSNGPNSMGSYDVFKTVYSNGKWSVPVNLGYPINTHMKEGQITLSADAKFAYVSSNRSGGLGESDVYKIDLKDYSILESDGKKKSGNGLSILRGVIRDGAEGFGLSETDIVVTDEAGAEVASTVTNDLGEYFLTLKAGSYNLSVKHKGFKDISEKIEMKNSDKETFSLEKGYLMKK